jgi:hypothetical protein
MAAVGNDHTGRDVELLEVERAAQAVLSIVETHRSHVEAVASAWRRLMRRYYRFITLYDLEDAYHEGAAEESGYSSAFDAVDALALLLNPDTPWRDGSFLAEGLGESS